MDPDNGGNWSEPRGQKILCSLKGLIALERGQSQKLHKIGFMSNEDQHNWNYRWISLNILQVRTYQT